MFLNLTTTPKIAPKGQKKLALLDPKKSIEAPNRTLLPHPKLIVYKSRFQKTFRT